jgi:hypothetical protein
MSAALVYDFESIVETAAKAVLTSLETKSFTTTDKPDFQKDRPRVEIKFTLGADLQQFAVVLPDADGNLVNIAVDPTVAVGVSQQDLFYARRESAWAFNLRFDLLTGMDLAQHIEYRAEVRCALARFWRLINGAPGMTRHCVQLAKGGGGSPILVSPETGIMKTEMSFSGTISVQADAWSALSDDETTTTDNL